MTTSKLFGVSPEVAAALKDTQSHTEYLKIGIVLMNRVQNEIVDDYLSKDFAYRANAIKDYEEWLTK